MTGITVGPNEFVRCEAKNKIIPGTIEIEKAANPQGAQQFAFTGSGRDRRLHPG